MITPQEMEVLSKYNKWKAVAFSADDKNIELIKHYRDVGKFDISCGGCAGCGGSCNSSYAD